MYETQTRPPGSPASAVPPAFARPHARRLARSRRERLWAGVCGGVAEYFDVDPVVVRLVWVAATVFSHGLAIPVYIALWFIMPRGEPERSDPLLRDGFPPADVSSRPRAAYAADPPRPVSNVEAAADPTNADPTAAPAPAAVWWAGAPPSGERTPIAGRQRAAGVILVALGLLFMASEAGVFRAIPWNVVWPLILVAVGAGLLLRRQDPRPW